MALMHQRQAFLEMVASLIEQGNWEEAYSQVTQHGATFGRSQRWKDACKWFEVQREAGKPLEWIVGQGHTFLVHANA